MHSHRILIVDDTNEVRTLFCRVLAAEGYDIVEAADGISALQACQNLDGDVHLLLTDINMPGMCGMELAARLRSRYPEVYVLYISGQSEGDRLQAQPTDHRCGFLSKPFLQQTLIQIVQRALVMAKGPGQAAGLSVFSNLQDKKTA